MEENGHLHDLTLLFPCGSEQTIVWLRKLFIPRHICLTIQIITELSLAIHYCSNIDKCRIYQPVIWIPGRTSDHVSVKIREADINRIDMTSTYLCCSEAIIGWSASVTIWQWPFWLVSEPLLLETGWAATLEEAKRTNERQAHTA